MWPGGGGVSPTSRFPIASRRDGSRTTRTVGQPSALSASPRPVWRVTLVRLRYSVSPLQEQLVGRSYRLPAVMKLCLSLDGSTSHLTSLK